MNSLRRYPLRLWQVEEEEQSENVAARASQDYNDSKQFSYKYLYTLKVIASVAESIECSKVGLGEYKYKICKYVAQCTGNLKIQLNRYQVKVNL